MTYSEKDLFALMDSGKTIKVTCTDGKIFTGRCWAYGAIQNEMEHNIPEASIDIGPGITLFVSEIEKIEDL